MNPDNIKTRSTEDERFSVSNDKLNRLGGKQGLAQKLFSSLEVRKFKIHCLLAWYRRRLK